MALSASGSRPARMGASKWRRNWLGVPSTPGFVNDTIA